MMLQAGNAQVALDLPMSNLLALDQSSHTTGYTVLRNGTIIAVDHFECIGSDLGDRLVQLRKNIEALIEKYNIDEVVFEDIQLQDVNGNKETGIKTFKILAEAFGVVEELLTEKKIEHSAVLPIKWKAHFKIAGKGRAQEKKLA
jgi:Holliday junction resolvasome RuvABC endonuclease subunit